MLDLIIAFVTSAMVTIFMRIGQKKAENNISLLLINYIICLLLALLHTGLGGLGVRAEGLLPALGMGVLNGFFYLLGFVAMQHYIKVNGAVMTATFMKLGLLVPMAVSIGLFGELPTAVQLLGFALALAAIVVINFEKEETQVKSRAGLILLIFIGGSADTMAKFFDELGNPALSEQFLLVTFTAALLLCLCLMLWKKQRIGKNELIYGAIIGVPNYYTARFLLRSLDRLPAVIVYPTYSVATIVLVTLAGLLLFKEKLGKKQLVGIGLILAALALLNM